MLVAVTRPMRRAAQPVMPQLIARRCLGDTVRGPPLTDIARNFKSASEFFTKGGMSYAEYKQQCVSLRLFAFAGVTTGCVAALCWDPPKSSYWQRWGISFWWSHLKATFSSGAPPLFLTEKVCHEVDVPAIVGVLIPRGQIVMPAVAEVEPNPKVLFVLGGPGAGKGTQCAQIIDNFPHWAHISAGDCLRAERNDPNSKDGELINNIIKEGKIVPSEITVSLLEKAMIAQRKEGKTSFLIDGFPRSLGNVNSWEQVIGDRADVLGVLYYKADEQEMERRLLGRGQTSGRVDDNIESIKKRFKTYLKETLPIIEKYAAKGMVFTIDGMPPPDKVWKITQSTIQKVEGGK